MNPILKLKEIKMEEYIKLIAATASSRTELELAAISLVRTNEVPNN